MPSINPAPLIRGAAKSALPRAPLSSGEGAAAEALRALDDAYEAFRVAPKELGSDDVTRHARHVLDLHRTVDRAAIDLVDVLPDVAWQALASSRSTTLSLVRSVQEGSHAAVPEKFEWMYHSLARELSEVAGLEQALRGARHVPTSVDQSAGHIEGQAAVQAAALLWGDLRHQTNRLHHLVSETLAADDRNLERSVRTAVDQARRVDNVRAIITQRDGVRAITRELEGPLLDVLNVFTAQQRKPTAKDREPLKEARMLVGRLQRELQRGPGASTLQNGNERIAAIPVPVRREGVIIDQVTAAKAVREDRGVLIPRDQRISRIAQTLPRIERLHGLLEGSLRSHQRGHATGEHAAKSLDQIKNALNDEISSILETSALTQLPDAFVRRFENLGHRLWTAEAEELPRLAPRVRKFIDELAKIDTSRSGGRGRKLTGMLEPALLDLGALRESINRVPETISWRRAGTEPKGPEVAPFVATALRRAAAVAERYATFPPKDELPNPIFRQSIALYHEPIDAMDKLGASKLLAELPDSVATGIHRLRHRLWKVEYTDPVEVEKLVLAMRKLADRVERSPGLSADQRHPVRSAVARVRTRMQDLEPRMVALRDPDATLAIVREQLKDLSVTHSVDAVGPLQEELRHVEPRALGQLIDTLTELGVHGADSQVLTWRTTRPHKRDLSAMLRQLDAPAAAKAPAAPSAGLAGEIASVRTDLTRVSDDIDRVAEAALDYKQVQHTVPLLDGTLAQAQRVLERSRSVLGTSADTWTGPPARSIEAERSHLAQGLDDIRQHWGLDPKVYGHELLDEHLHPHQGQIGRIQAQLHQVNDVLEALEEAAGVI